MSINKFKDKFNKKTINLSKKVNNLNPEEELSNNIPTRVKTNSNSKDKESNTEYLSNYSEDSSYSSEEDDYRSSENEYKDPRDKYNYYQNLKVNNILCTSEGNQFLKRYEENIIKEVIFSSEKIRKEIEDILNPIENDTKVENTKKSIIKNKKSISIVNENLQKHNNNDTKEKTPKNNKEDTDQDISKDILDEIQDLDLEKDLIAPEPESIKEIKKSVNNNNNNDILELVIYAQNSIKSKSKVSNKKNTNKISLKPHVQRKDNSDFQKHINSVIDPDDEDYDWQSKIDKFKLDEWIDVCKRENANKDFKYTHTSMKGGSFTITHDNYDIEKFEYLYVKELNTALRSKRKQAYLFLQECCNDSGYYRLFVDLDSGKSDITDDILDFIISTTLDMAANILEIPDSIRVYKVVRNQKNPNRKIHLIFPDIILLKRDIKYIMKRVADYLDKDIASVIDLNYSGLRLIGSLKPGELDPETEKRGKPDFDAIYVPDEVFDRGYYTVDDIRNYSIIPNKDQVPLRLLDTYIDKLKLEEKRKQDINEFRDKFHSSIMITGALLSESINLLKSYRADLFHNWKYIIQILCDITPNKAMFKRMAHEFSKKCMEKYDKKRVAEYINKLEPFNKFTFTNLFFAIKQDCSREDFKNFLKKFDIPDYFYNYKPVEIDFDKIEGVKVDPYTQEKIKPFDFNKAIEFIMSPMNTQKTRTVIKYILDYLEIYKNIIFVTSRVSFANSLKMVLKDAGLNFSLYNDKGAANEHYQIIQVESLNKNIMVPDLVVLDEITSVICQLSSPYHKENLTMNHEAFSNIIRDAKKVICMDADIDMRAIELFKNLRPNDTIYMQINNIKRNHLTAIQCNSKYSAFHKLKSLLEDNKNIFIVLGSVNFGRKIEQMILKPLEIDYLFINKDSDDNTIKNINVNQEWVKHRVVMITSTITNGIDFNESHFHSTFVFGNSLSNHVRDTKQMMGRVRNLIDNTIYFWNKTRKDILPYTMQDIKDQIESRLMRGNDELKKMFTSDQIQYILNNVGTTIENGIYCKKLNNDIFTKLFLMNQVEINLSKNFYDILFAKMITDQGIKLIPETDLLNTEDEECYQEAEKLVTAIIQDIDREVYKETPIVDDAELKQINIKAMNLEATHVDKKTKQKNEFLRLFNKQDVNEDFDHENSDYSYIYDNIYLECKDKVQQLHNVKLELESNIRDVAIKDINVFYNHYKDNDKYNFKPKHTQLKCIREICSILNIKGSYDTETVIKWQTIQENIEWFAEKYSELKDVFGLRNRSKDKNKQLEYRDVITTIKRIFKEWSSSELLEYGEQQNVTLNGKRLIKYDYLLVLSEGFLTLVDNLKLDVKHESFKKISYHKNLFDKDKTEKPRLIKRKNVEEILM